MHSARQSLTIGLVATLTLLALSIAIAMRSGAVELDLGRIFAALTSQEDSEARFILLNLRLPRTLVAGLVGAALAGAGAIYQSFLRNPLADPFILGISGGAAAGAVLAIAAGMTYTAGLPAAAFLGALAAMAVVYSAAKRFGRIQIEVLLLAGVIANAFFSAVIMFVLAIADPNSLLRSYHWLMGNLATAEYRDAAYLAPLVALPAFFVLWEAKRIHLMQLGTETAWHLGVDVRRLERLMFLSGCLLTAGSVAVAGMIGFVGLITPHIIRRLFTSDFRVLFPLCLPAGAALLILSDTAARTILAPGELPVGVLTAALGAPIFLVLLRKRGA